MPIEHADGKIVQDTADGVGLVTFNNPAKRNAMSLDMWDGLAACLTAFAEDGAVRVVVLTGAGDKAFVSGADISQFEAERHNAEAAEAYAQRSAAARAMLAGFAKPTIACIRGFCIGGGLQLAMMADIRVAAEGSSFGIPAARLGIAYGYEGLRNLVTLVGPAHARLLMFTGGRIDAAEALRIGLIERLVAPGAAMDTAMEIARTVAGNAPLAVKAAKVTIAEILRNPAERDLALVKRLGDECMDSADFREGRRAFMEKRAPRFTGA